MSPKYSRLLRALALVAIIAALVLAVTAQVYVIASIIAFAGVALILSNFESDFRKFHEELQGAGVDVANVDPKAVLELRRANPGMSIAEAIKTLEKEKG